MDGPPTYTEWGLISLMNGSLIIIGETFPGAEWGRQREKVVDITS